MSLVDVLDGCVAVTLTVTAPLLEVALSAGCACAFELVELELEVVGVAVSGVAAVSLVPDDFPASSVGVETPGSDVAATATLAGVSVPEVWPDVGSAPLAGVAVVAIAAAAAAGVATRLLGATAAVDATELYAPVKLDAVLSRVETALSAVLMVAPVRVTAVSTAPTRPYTVPASNGGTPMNCKVATVALATPSARLLSALAAVVTRIALVENGSGTKPATTVVPIWLTDWAPAVISSPSTLT